MWPTWKGSWTYIRQTFIDTYSKVAHCKLYTTKIPITSADILNDKLLPFYAIYDFPMLQILTDRRTEFCGRVEHHDYQLYLANQWHRPYQNKGNVTSNQWYLRTFPQNHSVGILSGNFPQEALPWFGVTAKRPGQLDRLLQWKNSSGQNLQWKNTYGDFA